MRLVIKTKSTGRIIRNFDYDHNYQVFLAFENFLIERLHANDFSEKAEYILEIRR